MTTIAYDGKTVAVDSRATIRTTVLDDKNKKWIEKDGGIMFLCGSQKHIVQFARSFKDGEECAIEDCDAGGIYISDKKVFLVFGADGKFWQNDITGILWADGSGRDFAVAAMDHGKTAEQAVKYASTRCTITGGHIHVFDVKTQRKIK